MTARQQLSELYEQWHRLTQAETGFIAAKNWSGLASCQQEKSALQPQIDFWSGQLAEGSGAAGERGHFGSVVQELLFLEEQNRRRVIEQLESARKEQRSFEQAICGASRRQKSSSPPASAWEAYS
jgi:hypothetical protein